MKKLIKIIKSEVSRALLCHYVALHGREQNESYFKVLWGEVWHYVKCSWYGWFCKHEFTVYTFDTNDGGTIYTCSKCHLYYKTIYK